MEPSPPEPNSPSTNPEVQPPLNTSLPTQTPSSRSFPPKILFGILFLALLSLVGLFLAKSLHTPTTDQPIITPTPSVSTLLNSSTYPETADWKTYTNSNYQFSIQYPPNWKQAESTSQGYPYISFVDPLAQQASPSQTHLDKGAEIFLSMTDASSYAQQPVTLSILKDIFLQPSQGSGIESDPNPVKEAHEQTIAKLKGLRTSYKSKTSRSEGFFITQKINNQELVFKFELVIYGDLENLQQANEYITTFDQILSTFKFLN